MTTSRRLALSGNGLLEGIVRRLVWCVMVASVLGITAAASAQADSGSFEDEEARALFQAGRTAFQAGRFDAALEHFEAAYKLSHRPQLLYNIGSAADRLRMDRKALEAFRAYLHQVPDAHNRQEVESRIRVLERAVEPAQTAKPPAEHASSASTAAASTTKPPAQTAPETHEQPTETTTQAPTPLEAAMQSEAAEAEPAGPEPAEEQSEGGGVASKWWFWTIIGAVVVGASVGAGVALAGGGGGGETFVSGNQPGGVTYALGGR